MVVSVGQVGGGVGRPGEGLGEGGVGAVGEGLRNGVALGALDGLPGQGDLAVAGRLRPGGGRRRVGGGRGSNYRNLMSSVKDRILRISRTIAI